MTYPFPNWTVHRLRVLDRPVVIQGCICYNVTLIARFMGPTWGPPGSCRPQIGGIHDVQISCAITQPLLAHHWRVHQCLLTSRFTAPLIPWGASAPGGKVRKKLLKDHNFINNSLIFIIESSTLIYLLFKKHCTQYISIWKIVLDLVKGTWHHNFMAGCVSLLWANTCSLWSGIKSWPWAGCLQRQVRRSWQ